MGTASVKRSDDLRVIKTRRAIEEAFGRLLNQMDYSKITVTAIAKEAKVNRKTFYAHYDTINDLLASIIDDEIDTIYREAIELSSPNSLHDSRYTLSSAILKTLDMYYENETNILRSVPLPQIISMVRRPLERNIAAYRERLGLPMTPQLTCGIAFYVGGLLSVYTNWKHGPLNDLSLEEIAEMTTGMLTYDAAMLLR